MQTCDPLKDADCKALNSALQLNAEACAIIDKLKAAGVPVDEYEAANNGIGDLCRNLKAQFFPLAK